MNAAASFRLCRVLRGVGMSLAWSTGIHRSPCLGGEASVNRVEKPRGLWITQELLLIEKDVALKSKCTITGKDQRNKAGLFDFFTFCASFRCQEPPFPHSVSLQSLYFIFARTWRNCCSEDSSQFMAVLQQENTTSLNASPWFLNWDCGVLAVPLEYFINTMFQLITTICLLKVERILITPSFRR